MIRTQLTRLACLDEPREFEMQEMFPGALENIQLGATFMWATWSSALASGYPAAPPHNNNAVLIESFKKLHHNLQIRSITHSARYFTLLLLKNNIFELQTP